MERIKTALAQYIYLFFEWKHYLINPMIDPFAYACRTTALMIV